MDVVSRSLDRVFLGFAKWAPGWVVALAAVLIYGGCGLALPLSLHWRLIALVEANAMSTVVAGLVCVAWLIVQAEAAQRRHLVEWTTNLRLLTSSEFEWLVGELFGREGWKVKETGKEDGPDGNIDLELTRDGERKVVQCKRWQSWVVPVEEVRAFAGTLMREGLRGSDGVFVTLSSFSGQARDEAAKTGLVLIDGPELHARMERARRLEPCPKCGQAMVLAYSSYGWWLRCTGCPGKRDLGGEPGRALDLLMKRP